MRFSFQIAKRYLFAKKSHNIINVISIISVLGVMTGTMALVVVLSVFNGFEDLIVSLFSSFNSDIEISPKQGKVFTLSTEDQESIRNIPGLVHYVDIVQDDALLKYGDNTAIATVKGVSDDYLKMVRIDTMMYDGTYQLYKDQHPVMLVAYGIAYQLNLQLQDVYKPIITYMPKRGKKTFLNPTKAFNKRRIFPTGIFSVQQEIDAKYVIVPINFMRDLLDYNQNQISAIELGISSSANIEEVKERVQEIVGDKFIIKDKFQQQGLLFKIMQSEKLIVFIILSFILFIAAFNVIGTLSMLIIDKRKDIGILSFLGANQSQIKGVFFIEGFMIMMIGSLLGIILGVLICWVQQHFGLVSLQSAGTFVIDVYPVKMELLDIGMILLIDIVIGVATIWYPARIIASRYMK